MPLHLLPVTRRQFMSVSATAFASWSLSEIGNAENEDSKSTTFALLFDSTLSGQQMVSGYAS